MGEHGAQRQQRLNTNANHSYLQTGGFLVVLSHRLLPGFAFAEESMFSRVQVRRRAAYFGRHTDKETGVGPWFKPYKLQYEFTYAGIGKKGGY